MTTIENIITATAEVTGIPYAEIKGASRKQNYVDARMIVTVVCRLKGFTFEAIARKMNKHHTSIIHLDKTFNAQYQTDTTFQNKTEKVCKGLKLKKTKRLMTMKKVSFGNEPQLWATEMTDFFNFDCSESAQYVKECVDIAVKSSDVNKEDFHKFNDFQIATSSQLLVDELKDSAYGCEIAFVHTHIPANYGE